MNTQRRERLNQLNDSIEALRLDLYNIAADEYEDVAREQSARQRLNTELHERTVIAIEKQAESWQRIASSIESFVNHYKAVP
jgi:phage terminase Nu1 subunit (DNA packaging protein)